MIEQEILERYEPILTLFFAGRLPRFNHVRHMALANILPQGARGFSTGLESR